MAGAKLIESEEWLGNSLSYILAAYPALLGLALLAAIPCCAMGQAANRESNPLDRGRGVGRRRRKVDLILTITKLAGGEYSGELVSVDQGASLPMENVTLKDDACGLR
jgi:hypothetical protein